VFSQMVVVSGTALIRSGVRVTVRGQGAWERDGQPTPTA
jgi:hypothetical protein